MASYDEARVGFAAGITKVTHLFNAMPPIEARAPGLAGAALGDSRVVVGIIPDGVHVHPAAVRLAWRAKGRQGLVIVTDSMAAMGMPPGQYILGDYPVTVDGRAARLANNTLAGSMITMDQAVRNLATWCEVELHEAVLAASQTPAEVLGLDRKGYIQKGADADLILLDHAGAVQQTYIGGSLVYQANKEVNNFNLENSQ
jgi:N-acetylglucosamine-6-phosphate deacetylase